VKPQVAWFLKVSTVRACASKVGHTGPLYQLGMRNFGGVGSFNFPIKFLLKTFSDATGDGKNLWELRENQFRNKNVAV